MKQFLEYIAQQLCRSPEEVEVTESVEDSVVFYQLSVAPDDVGRVIGRDGRVVRAMRVLLRASGARQGVRVALQVR